MSCIMYMGIAADEQVYDVSVGFDRLTNKYHIMAEGADPCAAPVVDGLVGQAQTAVTMLLEKGIPVPAGLLRVLNEHKAQHVGNKIVRLAAVHA